MIVKITIYEGETLKSLIKMFGPINKYSWLWEPVILYYLTKNKNA